MHFAPTGWLTDFSHANLIWCIFNLYIYSLMTVLYCYAEWYRKYNFCHVMAQTTRPSRNMWRVVCNSTVTIYIYELCNLSAASDWMGAWSLFLLSIHQTTPSCTLNNNLLSRCPCLLRGRLPPRFYLLLPLFFLFVLPSIHPSIIYCLSPAAQIASSQSIQPREHDSSSSVDTRGRSALISY